MKKLLALVLAVMMVMAMAVSAQAASITINSTADPNVTESDTTQYTWYKIFDADISTAPAVGTDGTTTTAGTASYYVDTEAKATAVEGTNLFNVTSNGAGRWYIELKDKNTSAETIATALNGIKDSFPSGTFAQTTPGGTATADTLGAGYYLITSTLGNKLVVQTLADVTINTKNDYPGVEKEIAPADANSEIGSIVTYTLTVTVPESANDQIVLTDTMDNGLTFSEITSVTNTDGNVEYTLAPENPAATDKTFTITFSKETITASAGKNITIIYKAMVNKDALIETDIPNEVKLDYGNRYESKPSEAKTKTYKAEFDKVDGEGNKLAGAEFQLLKGTTPMNLVEVTPGVEYRVATTEDTTTTTTITTIGQTITIKGLDLDETYKLHETKAPTGFNLLETDETLTVEGNAFVHVDVVNQKGTTLPSTGGIGTTIFYAAGLVLVLGAAVVLISRRKAEAED